MANINICAPSACYNVEKILEISQGQGNHKTYKVQWAPSWVSEAHLMGCDGLIQQFLSQKESFVDVLQNIREEIKQEIEYSTDQNEVESAHGRIDIFTDQVQEDSAQSGVQNEDILCDTIKIEEDDPVELTESHSSNGQENNEVHHNEVDDAMDDHREVSSNTNYNKIISTSDDQNEPDSFIDNQDTNDEKPNINFEIRLVGPTHLGNDSSMTLDKQLVSNDIDTNIINAKDTSVLLQESRDNCMDHDVRQKSIRKNNKEDFSTHPQYDRNGMQNIIKDTIRQNQNASSTKNISSFLQHPSKNLANSTSSQGSIAHRKVNFLDTTNNCTISSTYSKFTNNYTHSSSNPLETTSTSVTTEQNTNATDNERQSTLTDHSMNVLGSSYEHPVVNHGTEKSNIADDLRHKKYAKSPVSLPYLNQRVRYSAPVNNVFYKELNVDNNNGFSETFTLREHNHTTNFGNPEQTPHPQMVTSEENSVRPTLCNVQKYIGNMYACQICNITFTYKKLYERHMKLHLQKKVFTCNVCSKEFHCKYNLRCHERVHTDERPYSCEVCGRKFKDYSNLKMHIRRTHTMERPYKCNMCTKIFASTSDLKKHIRTHTGERPYGCVFCNKRFKTSSQLRGHTRKCSPRT